MTAAITLAQAVARYHAGCLRVIGAQNVALRDVRTTKKAAICIDLGRLIRSEEVLARGRTTLRAPTAPPEPSEEQQAEYERQLTTWERARDLAAKAAVESHSKEVVYGAPLLSGFLPKRSSEMAEPVLAPLLMQSVTIAVGQTGEITITATDEPPRFNTAVWQDAVRADDLSQIIGLGIDAQGDLGAGYDPARVELLLRAIASIFPAVLPAEPDGSIASWPEIASVKEHRDEPVLRLHDGAVLFLANRASPYLLHDLETIAADPAPLLAQDRPLSVMLNPPATKARPELEARSLEHVVYPFPSNAAQRQVAEALAHNRIVVVQGPPGNGKSLTIANLVAHLVADGKRVLVASHKNQALTVVRDKLESVGQRFLYASLIGDGAAAKRGLQRQIADVKAFAGAANRAALERQLADIEAHRAASGHSFRARRQEFIARAEPEQQEAAELYERFRGVELLPVEDEAAANADHHPATAGALRRLDALARDHVGVWNLLCHSPAAYTYDHTAELSTLRAFVDSQRARLVAGTDRTIGEFVEAWHPIVDGEPAQIELAQQTIEDIRGALLGACPSSGSVERRAGDALHTAPALREDVERGVAQLQVAFDAARELAEHRNAVSAPVERRAQVLQQHALLASLWKRGGARKWLDEHAPGAAGLSPETVKRWAAFWNSWERLRTLADGLAGGLRTELPATFDPDAAQLQIARAQNALARASALSAVQAAAGRTRVPLPLDQALAAADPTRVTEILGCWAQALAGAAADRTGNELKLAPELDFLDGSPRRVDELLDRADYAGAAELLDALDMVLVALPALGERRQLLDNPLETLQSAAVLIEAAAHEDADSPPFMSDIDRALDVHADVRRFFEIGEGPLTGDVASTLSGLTGMVMDDARRLLGAKIQSRILGGFRKPSFLASLEMFRKAIGASPKRFERFDELKNSPNFDVDVLTDVFPCWIMRPEDACRVFPLRADVFDVVIFDEASQCNPDQVLPLFARASRALIVGDDKQLSNEDLRRSLSTNANAALLRQAGLDRLDPGGLFDQTRNSLLELVSHRQQASVLLNEHFRCRPEIVAFSNAQFYGNTLTVIRDREDDHGLGPALVIREVQTDDVAIPGSKVNYTEAAALVADLKQRLADERYAGMSFGVLSLFREQTEHLKLEIDRQIPTELRERHRLICSTVDGFQGDERDVILYSWRYTHADHPAMFAFTNGGGGEQRINVALTRARHQAVHFVSVPAESFPASAANISAYLRHAAHPQLLLQQAEDRVHREPAGPARVQLRDALAAQGLEVTEDYVACGVSVDLLVQDTDAAKRIAVFVDADRAAHRPPDTPERVDQHALLERAGWTVERAAATDVLAAGDNITTRVLEALRATDPLRSATQRAEPAHSIVSVSDVDAPVASTPTGTRDFAPEDRVDFHWDAPSVEQRLAGGEDVFQSGFERDLYSMLARIDGIHAVPQWATRGKSIDLVLTDRQGRRLAVEADGAQHHESDRGDLIPEDLYRQALLEEAGWGFCRVRHADFVAQPDAEIDRVTEALACQSKNPDLAALVWTDRDLLEALSTPSEIAPPPAPQVEGPLLEAASLDGGAATVVTGANGSESRVLDPTAAVEHMDLPLLGAAERTSGRSEPAVLPPLAVQSEPANLAPLSERCEPAVPSPLPEAGAMFEDPAEQQPSTNANPPPSEVAEARVPGPAIHPEPAATAPAMSTAGPPIEEVLLGELVLLVSQMINECGAVPEGELVAAFETHFGSVVPLNWHRTLKRFAWTAKGSRYLDLLDGVWVPGTVAPQADPRYGDWTFARMVRRARELLPHDDDPFDDLLAEVYGGTRVPKIVMSLVGAALKQAH